jgi:Na+/melibiose symporter-like transporter
MIPLALQLSPHDDPPIWRMVALIAVAIGVWTYVVVLFRARRREKQNPTPSEPHTIKLWKVEFPELNHLPTDERERLLRSALENTEVETFRRATRRLMAIIFYTAMAILIAIAVTTSQPAWLVTACFVPALLITFIATIFIRIQLELKIVRRLLKQSLTSMDKANSAAPNDQGPNPDTH